MFISFLSLVSASISLQVHPFHGALTSEFCLHTMAPQQLAVISRSDLENLAIPALARITNFKHLGSYTWWDKATPTISVPGDAPLWSPPPTSSTAVPADSGTAYIDENAARNPSSPLEPLFRALSIMNPSFSLGRVDLVTDRNNIRKLLRFVRGDNGALGYGTSNSKDSFQIRVEVVRPTGTVLFTRVEPKSVDVIVGFQGYGRNFEKVYTTKRAEGMSGYHRVVAYNFGGLRCVVRHETDGYVTGDLLNSVGALSLSESTSEPTVTPTGLNIMSGQNVNMDVGVSSTLEIKTRAASRTLDMEDVYPQLWASQTPQLAVGYHRHGVFTDVRVSDKTDDVARWEAVNRDALEKLAGLLTKIISVVKQSDGARAVVEYTGGASLRIVADTDGQPALPEDLYSKWKDEPAATVTTSALDKGKNTSGKAADTSLIPLYTPLASDMEYAIQKGPRQFFVRLPGNISDYRTLCHQLKSLPTEALDKILRGWSFTLKDIMADFRKGKDDYDPLDRRDISGQKTVARDAAFRLVYTLLSGQVEDRDRPMAYNAVFFVVSHCRIFGVRTRQMVRAAFEDKFVVTPKQRAVMDQWTRAWPIENPGEGEDETTSSEEVFYGSDYSDFY